MRLRGDGVYRLCIFRERVRESRAVRARECSGSGAVYSNGCGAAEHRPRRDEKLLVLCSEATLDSCLRRVDVH